MKEIHLWHVTLNSPLFEPLANIYVRSQPTIVSIDTGLEVNYIPYKLIELLDLHNDTKATRAKCAGPNGEILRTYGEIYIDFQLDINTYNAKSIVVHPAQEPLK